MMERSSEALSYSIKFDQFQRGDGIDDTNNQDDELCETTQPSFGDGATQQLTGLKLEDYYRYEPRVRLTRIDDSKKRSSSLSNGDEKKKFDNDGCNMIKSETRNVSDEELINQENNENSQARNSFIACCADTVWALEKDYERVSMELEDSKLALQACKELIVCLKEKNGTLEKQLAASVEDKKTIVLLVELLREAKAENNEAEQCI